MKVLFFLFFTFSIVACSKKEELPPSLADQVASSYTVTNVTIFGIKLILPFKDPNDGSTMTGNLEIKKVADDKIKGSLIFSYKDASGNVDNDDPIEISEVTLKQISTGTIEAYEGTKKIGAYSNNELNIEIQDEIFGPVLITAKK